MTSDVQILQNILRSIKQYYDPQKNLVSVRPGDPIFNEPAGGESSPESSPLSSISQAPEEELGFLDKALMRLYGQDENKYREGLALAKLKGERQKEELRGLEGKDLLGGFDPTGYDPTTVSGPPGVEEQLLEQLNKGVELATAFGGGVGTQVKFGSGAKPTTQLGGSASTHAIQEMMRGAAPAGRPRPSDRPTEVLGGHKLDPEGRPIREAVKIQEGADYGYDPVGDGINVKMVPSGRVLKLEEAKQELKKIREAPRTAPRSMVQDELRKSAELADLAVSGGMLPEKVKGAAQSLPPVPEGMTRVFRVEGKSAKKAGAAEGVRGGDWFETSLGAYVSPETTPENVLYVDIPTARFKQLQSDPNATEVRLPPGYLARAKPIS